MGFALSEDNLIMAAQATAYFLKEQRGSCTCYLIGEEAFKKKLEEDSHIVLDSRNPHDAQWVVVGTDRHFTYKKLDAAVRLLLSGAKLVAAHRNRFYAERIGLRVAAGPIVAALEYASSKAAISIG